MPINHKISPYFYKNRFGWVGGVKKRIGVQGKKYDKKHDFRWMYVL